MNNLFSIFDPTSNLSLSLNWSSVVTVLMMPSLYWGMTSKIHFSINKTLTHFKKEISMNMKKQLPSSSHLMLTTLLMLLMVNNFYSLLPYVFSPTSHLSVTLSLALPWWLGYILWNMLFNTSSMFANLTPRGTPLPLIPVMVVIELVSNIIRPLTLSIRLMANMVAGHLILTLISSSAMAVPIQVMAIVMMMLIILTMLEVAVSFIQAYVFMTLSSLYVGEINNINN